MSQGNEDIALREAAHENLTRCEELLSRCVSRIESSATDSEVQMARKLLCVAASKRLSQGARSLAALAELSALEDMSVLIRSLIETAINVAYLQHGSDEELHAYLNFDYIPIGKLVRRIDELVPGSMSQRMTTIVGKKLQDEIENAKQKSGKTDKDFGWTRLTVASRAQALDKHLGGPIFIPLSDCMFPMSHTFVHGNARSLAGFAPVPQIDIPSRHFRETQVIYTMTLVLVSLSAVIIKRYCPNSEEEMVHCARHLAMFTQKMDARSTAVLSSLSAMYESGLFSW